MFGHVHKRSPLTPEQAPHSQEPSADFGTGLARAATPRARARRVLITSAPDHHLARSSTTPPHSGRACARAGWRRAPLRFPV
eukprot:6229803-Prymnesium_polylepis.2